LVKKKKRGIWNFYQKKRKKKLQARS